jgi:hypothetical protein
MALTSCATLRELAALRQVEFVLERVTGAQLAGVAIDRVTSYRDLSALDIASIGLALARGELPFEITLHVAGLNPAENSVDARLVQMDWTLLLDDRETISGRIDREYLFRPGVRTEVPVTTRADLADFFSDKNAQYLVDLALAVAGVSGASPKRIALRATPTIQTALGPIRYPSAITIVSRTIGGPR